MTYRILPLLLVTCVTVAGAGFSTAACAQEDSGAMIDRLNRLERDLNNVQRQVYRGGAKTSGGGAVAADAAGLEVQIGTMQEQIQSLNGRVETLEHQLNQANKRLEQMTKDNEFRFQELEKKASQPAVALPAPAREAASAAPAQKVSTAQEAQAVTEDDGADGAETPENTTHKLAVKQEPRPDASGKYKFDNAVDQYNHAFKLLNQAKFDDAKSLLTDFVKKYPSDPLIGNAYYWLGEVHYVKRDYDTAAANFRQGYEKLPGGPKAPDNLLKLGMTLANQGEKEKACVILKSVQAKYPKASDSIRKTTTAELKRAGC